MRVLFVCTQNVFRSYSSEVLMKKYLDDNSIDSIEVHSAGIIAHSWESPYSWTFDKLKEFGVMDFNHKNRKVSKEILDLSDVIISMALIHKC
jgi:protein-tyrosine-phosphatase